MKVLIADDDPVTRRLLESNLRDWDYEVIVAEDGTQAWDVLSRDDAPRLAIIDWMMPGMDGIHLCQELRQRRSTPYTYLILLTVRGEPNDLVCGLGAGADDYLSKPFDPQELEVRLMSGKRILELQGQLIAARTKLEEQVTRDTLTGLFNRSAILDILKSELAREERAGIPLGLAMADLDHFKDINDTHGHLTGDRVLRHAAQRMQASIRPYDSLGRYGGEEFLIILPGCTNREAALVAERLRINVANESDNQDDKQVAITVSLGVASTGDSGRRSSDDLIQAADEALYTAKAKGRNRVETFES